MTTTDRRDTLRDADTDELIGAATPAQIAASDAAADSNGIFLMDADGDPIDPSSEWQGQPRARRVYTDPSAS